MVKLIGTVRAIKLALDKQFKYLVELQERVDSIIGESKGAEKIKAK